MHGHRNLIQIIQYSNGARQKTITNNDKEHTRTQNRCMKSVFVRFDSLSVFSQRPYGFKISKKNVKKVEQQRKQKTENAAFNIRSSYVLCILILFTFKLLLLVAFSIHIFSILYLTKEKKSYFMCLFRTQFSRATH